MSMDRVWQHMKDRASELASLHAAIGDQEAENIILAIVRQERLPEPVPPQAVAFLKHHLRILIEAFEANTAL
jgi:hypothetical protein